MSSYFNYPLTFYDESSHIVHVSMNKDFYMEALNVERKKRKIEGVDPDYDIALHENNDLKTKLENLQSQMQNTEEREQELKMELKMEYKMEYEVEKSMDEQKLRERNIEIERREQDLNQRLIDMEQLRERNIEIERKEQELKENEGKKDIEIQMLRDIMKEKEKENLTRELKDSQMQDINEKLKVELDKSREDFQEYVTLNKNKHKGEASMYKGAADEKYVEMVLKEVAPSGAIIDGSNGVRKMDVRVTIDNMVIGVECKDKKTVTQQDIDKFKKDKLNNKFFRSIFISTCQIKNILTEENTVYVDSDETYIYTNDMMFLRAVLALFFQNLPQDEDMDTQDNFKVLSESLVDNYKCWSSAKKAITKFDESFLRSMEMIDFNIKGHIYMVTSNKMKNGSCY